ncbi:uncharacterized protein LOC131429180 [Malaya genurostris]|uniref:uncharacterized protein LOC131429180 n=1 Tax=Malaya genurostris TaxID=325434 RepID=UPI0026F3B013|nr:uncharacterized protein LOC131429180 [Malaya genurostris]
MIGESKDAAIRRFQHLERRLTKDSELKKQYCEFMQEYLDLEHMKLIGSVDGLREEQKPVCYLPHHPVFKESSSTTKVRVVFDGSAKTSTNFSLNDALLTGPVIQDDLLDLMIRFRKHAVALVADIEKMYRQIRVHSEDTPLQRIVWRFNPSEPIQVYELLTVTYGLSPSSFLATRVLKQLALNSARNQKSVSVAVAEDFYMDDFLSGAESIEDAKRLRFGVQTLMAEAGLQLRKWNSNISEALEIAPEGPTILHFEKEPKVKTLGVAWETGPDQFCFDVRDIKHGEQWTKRKIFSAIAQLYDPLGLVSPVIAWAKIHMQQLWLSSVGWDDPVTVTVNARWEEFYVQLPELRSFKIPRCLFLAKPTDTQFHVFCDASELAYGACIYARSTNKDGEIKVTLISSKSRVAPLKRLSLPRLELCAALLGAKLYARVSAALRMEGTSCWFWSDSTVTLHWIQAPSNTWQTFVGNRTSEIQNLTRGHNWNHVKGVENPADYVSRGMLPRNFIANMIWLEGPAWLQKSQENWPEHHNPEPPPEDILERRKTVLVVQQNSTVDCLYERYSSFLKLVRVTAYILRFVNACKSKFKHPTDIFVTTQEMQAAKEALVKGVQQQTFHEELKALKNKRPLPSHSALKYLRPIIDTNGILRVGGRLQHSEEVYQAKHPMILPSKHPLSRLIAQHYHTLTLHSGPRMTLASIRQEFWPLRGKDLVNFVCRKCLICFRHRPVPATQPVGQLPKTRTVPSRPFTITGVDYCGPFYMKPVHRRASPQKAFIAVFICFATKAVHLELVCNLSTDAFIAALRRFIARRGLPQQIQSDNGTNFKGAKNTLLALYHMLNDKPSHEKIVNECVNRGIQWKFIPPRAPNFGGLWEAAVKTAKTSLIKTIGQCKLSYEDFVTLLTQIEANMNTRPLTPLSEDPSELDVLTPGHFLTGSSLGALPDPDYTKIQPNRLKHYQQLQQLIQQHWVRWKKEYLTEINSQHQKSSKSVQLEVGQLVLVRDDNMSSISWPLAQIITTYPGQDGHSRVVTVKTAAGVYTRPVSKIYPLPMNTDMQQQQEDTQGVAASTTEDTNCST